MSRRRIVASCLAAFAVACRGETAPSPTTDAPAAVAALTDSAFGALVARISEAGGSFDTDNLISNESAYLKVIGALERRAVHGGAYVGVGPDQNFSYIAHIRPVVAFVIDIRRDNLLHHLLLRALLERAPTRLEFLAGLHGRAPPAEPEAWRDRPIEDLVAWIDDAPADAAAVEALHAEIAAAVAAYGVPLSAADQATIRRFHQAFIDAGPALRFTSLGRAPRPYYPTYRQLVLETDLAGRQASYLADADDYAFVRGLEMDGLVVPVVGDLAGDHALREIGGVMREMDVRLSAFYASNVEFYLWQAGTFRTWVANLRTLPAAENAVVIRSYFPNFGRRHPSAVPGYYAAQTLQPVSTLAAGGFDDYWEVVTQDALALSAVDAR